MSSKQKKYENQPDNMEDSDENDSGEEDSDEDGSNPDIYKGNEVIFELFCGFAGCCYCYCN